MTHLIVEVASGPHAGQRRVLTPGSELTVGRTQRADLALEGDERLGGKHFTLAWDGSHTAVRDLQTEAGTLVNGERVAHAELSSDAWIRAGNTDFSLFIEGAPPAPALTSEERAREIAAALPSQDLYALFDAARSERILSLLNASIDERRCLFGGVTAQRLADASPYLVALDPESGLLMRFLQEGFGSAWGVLLTSRKRFETVRAHLRKFVWVVEDETEEKLYFRFYDPRVLRKFMPVATKRQRGELFEIIESFLCEDQSGKLVRWTRDRAPEVLA